MKNINLVIKNIFDIVVSLILMIVLSPLLLMIALLIKMDSKGPIFFKQKRLGRNGKIFEIYKFRTMCDNAVSIGSGIFTFEDDPRITKVGKFLRETSLDELPQLINIFKGEMSFVGPRPPLPHHPNKYENYPEKQKKRFLMKPGITGLAQAIGRNSFTWDERIELDVEYINNFNIFLDLKIYIMTALSVLGKKGIYRGENDDKSTSKN